MVQELPSKAAPALALLMALSCGPGVRSVHHPQEPLVRLRAEVVSPAPPGTPGEGLAGALVWASLPAGLEACLGRAGSVEEVIGCTGGDFRPQLTSSAVAVEPAFPSAFELPLYDLPDPAVLTGFAQARLGYGIVVVYHDGDSNRALDLVPPEATEGPDRVLGTSLEPGPGNAGDYLGFREGALSPAWNAFRILGGCPEPPQGYFIIRLRQTANGPGCELAPADAPLTVQLAESPAVRARICQHDPEAVSRFPSEPPPGSEVVCWGEDSLDLIRAPLAACRRAERQDLFSCASSDQPCSEVGWDLRAAVPPWWPCTGVPLSLELRAVEEPLGPGGDDLFWLEYLEGEGSYLPTELRVTVWGPGLEGELVLTAPDPLVIVGRPPLELLDRDSDLRFSRGDALLVREDEPWRFGTGAQGPYQVRVEAVARDGRVSQLAWPLVWVPR